MSECNTAVVQHYHHDHDDADHQFIVHLSTHNAVSMQKNQHSQFISDFFSSQNESHVCVWCVVCTNEHIHDFCRE